jgi:hypothetical protein
MEADEEDRHQQQQPSSPSLDDSGTCHEGDVGVVAEGGNPGHAAAGASRPHPQHFFEELLSQLQDVTSIGAVSIVPM